MAAPFRFESVHWDTLDPLDQLVQLSRYYGADTEFVVAGGGNTSVKIGGTLYVKASGFALATIGREGFVGLDRAKVLGILDGDYPREALAREDAVKDDLLASRVDPASGLRPSVEGVLHALIERPFVVHSHPATVNAVGCSKRGHATIRKLFGDAVVWLDYTNPGYALAKVLAEALDAFKRRTGTSPEIFFFGGHGFCVAADDPRRVKRLTDRVFRKLKQAGVGKWQRPPAKPPGAKEAQRRRDLVHTLAPALRGLLADAAGRRPIVRTDASPITMAIVTTVRGERVARTGPIYPDQICFCRSTPLWLSISKTDTPAKAAERLKKAVASYMKRRKVTPGVVLVEGVGMLAVGESASSAEAAEGIYKDVARVKLENGGFGGTREFTRAERKFIENWEAEAYRLKLAGGKTAGPVVGRVAIVTGGAQGIGAGIVEDLVAQGAHVMVADINADGAAATCEYLCEKNGAGRAAPCAVNVTDEASVAALVDRTVRTYGGVDLLVSNAGVLRAGSVTTLAKRDFDFVTDVNYAGYFVCTKHVAPAMAALHRANPDLRCDIIQINSKSGLEGSNRNAAYAGGKFGGIGLTQSFALELVDDGIKVNAVCPGNFFDGPLWSDPEGGLFVQYLRTGKVPGAKTVADVRAAYEAKVPMGRGVTIADIMRAIYYLVEQQYETGQALPVTGGQVMLS